MAVTPTGSWYFAVCGAFKAVILCTDYQVVGVVVSVLWWWRWGRVYDTTVLCLLQQQRIIRATTTLGEQDAGCHWVLLLHTIENTV